MDPTRREAIVCAATMAMGITSRDASAASANADVPRPTLALTIDDFSIDDGPLLSGEEKHASILATLHHHRIKAAGFPAGKFIDDALGARHLLAWSGAGHLVGCHGYEHHFYGGADPAAFEADLDRALPIVSRFATSMPLFRFPFLAEGRTIVGRDAARAALHRRSLSNGHVTIDTSDWYIASRLLDRLRREPGADLEPYRRFYIAHLLDRAAFYERLGRLAVGRSVPQTILLHHNLTTALFLSDALRAFRHAGWRMIDANEAFADPIFRREPRIVPAGQSLIWQLAKEGGGLDHLLHYPGEDGDYEKPKMDALGL